MKEINPPLDGTEIRVGIVASRFNDGITQHLLDGALKRLEKLDVSDESISLVWVAGAFEAPLASKVLAESGEVDTIICLGAVIRGETPHFDYVAGESASGIMQVNLDTGIPVIFGILTTENYAQALERADIKLGDKGGDCAEAAVEMAQIAKRSF